MKNEDNYLLLSIRIH